LELLRFSGLELHYGARTIFSDISGALADGERVALVGPNGGGKSSLLRLLAGVDVPFGGTIVRAKDARLGYLAQNVADETAATLQQLVDAALARTADPEWGLANKKLRAMLDGFGFASEDYVRPLRSFSGGQRAKAALAHLLIDDPDYLILDEPTNHLDIATVRWLETFIAADKRAYIIVSHDRYFIDRVATRVWEIERGRFHSYAPGTPAFSDYVRQRGLRIAAERQAYEAFVTERDKRRSTIAGLRATLTSSNYSRVRSREKQLARVESQMRAPEPIETQARIKVRLATGRRATKSFALEAEGLTKRYDRTLFSDLTFDVQQRDRLAIVGPNGSGKSTLLKMLAEQIDPDAGSVRFTPAMRVEYFAQSAHEQLDVDATAVEALLAAAPIPPEEARALLGRMRISGEAADKPVRLFSGGERRRIMLARLMARKATVLLLDEPTNDLDIESQEALESVLAEYEGALVIVSHDRYLLNALCDRVLWIDDGAWGLEDGYDAYEAVQRERDRIARERLRAGRDKPATNRTTPLKMLSQLKTKVARLEREIARLDARKAEIEELFTTTELYNDRERVKALQDEIERIATASHDAFGAWERATHELEAATETAR
jgi:ATP-binding cassette subfamily F protein 3